MHRFETPFYKNAVFSDDISSNGQINNSIHSEILATMGYLVSPTMQLVTIEHITWQCLGLDSLSFKLLVRLWIIQFVPLLPISSLILLEFITSTSGPFSDHRERIGFSTVPVWWKRAVIESYWFYDSFRAIVWTCN